MSNQDTEQKSKRERLEESLLEYVEKTLKEPQPEPEMLAIVPAVANTLVEFWKHGL